MKTEVDKLLCEHYFYNCSKEYVESIDPSLFTKINELIGKLAKREFQAEINGDLFLLLTRNKWAYDSIPQGLANIPQDDLGANTKKIMPQKENKRYLCSTSTTLEATWHSDFARSYSSGLVQLEVQFGCLWHNHRQCD